MELLANDYVVIDREDHPGSEVFRATPAICVTKTGRYVFTNELRNNKHPGSRPDCPHYEEIKPNPYGGTDHVGQIFISDDKGGTWRYVCARNFSQQRVFEAGGKLWILGHSDDLVIYCSEDNGETWDTDYILRDDAHSGDLGYPATVELNDGSLLTVYYQIPEGLNNAVIMQSIWRLPERE